MFDEQNLAHSDSSPSLAQCAEDEEGEEDLKEEHTENLMSRTRSARIDSF